MNTTSPSSSLDVAPQKQQQQQDDDNDDDVDRCWQNQHDWIERTRQYKQQLQNQGITGWDLMEYMTQFNLDHKRKTFSSDDDNNNNRKCENCWHPIQSQSCICGRLKPLQERIASQVRQSNKKIIVQAEEEGSCRQYHHHHHHHHQPFQAVKIILLMHPKEYYCAGNSGNLVLQVLPSDHHPNTSLSSASHSDSTIVTAQHYIFGKLGDVDRLWKQLSLQKLDSTTIILWPGPDAISLSTYLQQQQRLLQKETSEKQQKRGVSTATTTCTHHHTTSTTLNVIVLDGTYTQARNMFHSIRKRWSSNIDQSSLMLPQTIKLEPTSKSIFHRAQKRYGSSHQQSQQQQQQKNENVVVAVAAATTHVVRRISTAEACGLLLTQVLGMDFSIIEDCLIEAVQINNDVLAYARNRGKKQQ